MNKRIVWTWCLLLMAGWMMAQQVPALSGRIISKEKENVEYATVYLKGTSYGCSTNEQGMYHLHAPAGHYTLVVSAIGYDTVERPHHLDR